MQSRTSTTLLKGLEDPRDDLAWRRFYGRYAPMLLSYAKRVGLSDADAQDAVAETLAIFVQAYRAGRYDRDRARLKTWLGGIAQKVVHKLWARRSSASLESDPSNNRSSVEGPAAPDDRDAALEREWQLQRLSDAMDILKLDCNPSTFQAFDLYALKSWPVKKVADFLKMTPNAVYVSKTRMIQKLREIVRGLEEEEDE